MKFAVRGAAAVLLALLCATPAHAANVTVRVEGSSATLVAPTAATTSAGTFTKSTGAPACDRDSAGGALETATGGNWGGQYDGFGQRVETILGESHTFGSGAYWSIYVNDKPAEQGACTQPVQTGDAITFYPQCEAGPAAGCFEGLLLIRSAPASGAPGSAVKVSVDQVTTTYEPPTYDPVTKKTPAAGATVTIGGATATAGADGTATVTLGAATGVQDIKATLDNRVRASAALCVTDGADGACGTTKPGQVLGAGTSQTTSTTPAAGQPVVPDRDAPLVTLRGIADGAKLRHGRVPRRLSGQVADDASGIAAVKLRIVRRAGRKCWYYSGRLERLRGMRCGIANAKWFQVGDRADWSYLLPSQLPKGSYTVDVKAFDKAGNVVTTFSRGKNRVAFRVR